MKRRLIISASVTFAIILLLIFASPASALTIEITEPSPKTLGETIEFSVTITIEDDELLPIQSVDLEIFNEAAPTTFRITISDLPLTSTTKSYPTGGGTLSVEADPAAGWGYGYGYGYVQWVGYGYYFGYGYGYGYGPAAQSITYNVSWSSLDNWPAGDYVIEAKVFANGQTFSEKRTVSLVIVPPVPPPPPLATLTVDTTPVKASVYVDGALWGTAPQTRSVAAGTYTVSFGDYLGYLTPPPETVTLSAGETRTVTGVYTEVPPELIENESPPVDIPSITPDENAVIEVENTAITGMTIAVGESVENVRVTVQQLTDRPAEVAIGAPGVTYRYFNIVAENITDADIDVVSIDFRVERAWVTAENIDPDTIALRRWDPVAEVWESLPTTRIGEDDTYFYYSAESPGLSIFAVSGLTLPPAPAEFELSNLVIDPSEVEPGETVTISVVVTNIGELEGTYTVTLKIDNLVEATEDVTLAGGATETVTFPVSRDVEGTYNVEVDGLMGTFVVTPAPPVPPPIIPLVVAVALIAVALLAVILIWLRRRRRL